MPTKLEETSTTAKGTSNIIGIIHPPPDLKTLIDSTAKYVARVGVEFEQRIRKEKAHLTFLNLGDPYYAYYITKVKEFKDSGTTTTSSKTSDQTTEVKSKEFIKEEPEAPVLPPPDYEFLITVPTIAAMDIAIVKLTAQSVAKNGRQFLMSLMQRESRNYLFDFLRPHHILFGYFTKLVEQYTKIFLPSKESLENLKNQSTNREAILRRVKQRVAWENQQRKKKQDIQNKIEEEKRQYATIDWHDFTVVETVDFPEDDFSELPPLITRELLKQRIILQERYERSLREKQQVRAPEQPEVVPLPPKHSEEDEKKMLLASQAYEEEHEVHYPQPNEVTEIVQQNDIKIVEYDPKAPRKSSSSQEYSICPNCKQSILSSQMDEHLRVELLDPRWREHDERRRAELQEMKKTYASGMDMQANLKQLSKVRTDIFEGEEFQDSKAEKDKEKVIWDGFASSASAVSAAAQASVTHDDRAKALERNMAENAEADKIGPGNINASVPPPIPAPPVTLPPFAGSMPPPPLGMPGGPPGFMAPPLNMNFPGRPNFLPGMPMPPGMPPGFISNMQGLPPNMFPPMTGLHARPYFGQPPPFLDPKRVKVDETGAMEAPTVTFKIVVPHVPDKPEWNLSGQIVDAELKITQTIADIKTFLQNALQMPVSKQKLQIGANFLKDSETLLSYNFNPTTVVHLTVKERGGRKK
ncbi:splicing factor 3A subunit 1-like [Zophobas morio]|jgi:splicing factor 3A subunit 1|uniref:splicing factor 3A subunit 1-like n=1 Tax=Zophobas morio TaxID=2755281 RepID=UPI003082727B